MKKIPLVCLTVSITVVICAGVVNAFSVGTGTLEVDSLKVGNQGTGGVTYFNGTIINNTTGSSGQNMPVTFGDNVRIDGYVYRGTTAGINDSQPFKINDNAEVTGNLTVGGNSTDLQKRGQSDNLKVHGVIYSGADSGPQLDGWPTTIDDTLVVNGTITSGWSGEVGGGLDIFGDTWLSGEVEVDGKAVLKSEVQFGGYATLSSTDGQPPSSDCNYAYTGRMKFDDDNNKIWVCGSGGWKSFSSD